MIIRFSGKLRFYFEIILTFAIFKLDDSIAKNERRITMKKWIASLLIFLSGIIVSQEKTPITLDWMFSREPALLTATPRIQWLRDGTLMYLDTRISSENRTIDRYDPKKDRFIPALNLEAARRNLKDILGENTPDFLSWPLAFDNQGRRALYSFQEDLFVLETGASVLNRLTETTDEEKSPRLSPDGEHAAFVRNNDLFVFDLKTKKEIRLTSDGSESLLNGTLSWVYWEEIFNREDLGYWWSPDSRSIAYLQTDESMVTQVRWIDFKPVTPREIIQRYPKAGEANPKVRVGIADLSSLQTRWIDFGTDTFEYVIRVQWLPDGKRIAVQTMNRMQTELKLYFAGVYDGKANLILTETEENWVNEHDDLHFLKNGKEFFWTSERSGYNHIYRYSLDGKLINQVTRGEWAVRPSGRNEAIVGIDEKAGILYFTSQEKSSVEKHLYRIGFDGKKMTRISNEEGVHQIHFSPDLQFYTDRHSSHFQLPGLYLRKKDGKTVQTLAVPQTEKLANYRTTYPQYMTIPAGDGFAMPAMLYKPVDFDSTRKYPLIFYVYGGPSAPVVQKSWDRYFWYSQVLMNEGYLVTLVDNRSATAISKTLETTVKLQQAGDGELNDLIDAVRWYKRQPWIDSNRIGVWGASGGGQFTMMALSRTKEFKAGISVAGGTDWRYYDTKYTERTMKTPQVNPDGYEHTSLMQHAKNLHGRLMIIHGTYDDNVHPQHVWHFIDELIKANKQFDMMFYPMRKHGVGDRPGRIHYFHTMIDFWKKNL